MIKKLVGYLSGVYQEYKNISWPSRSEVIVSCIVVVILTISMTVFISFVDFIMRHLYNTFVDSLVK